MSIVKAEGIVLRSMKMGETSKLVTLFTREHGVLKAIAKGSRTSKSRFGAALEPLSVIQIVYYHKESRELQLLSAADIVETFPNLPADAERWGYACACGELVLRTHPGAEATPKLYPILLDTLRTLNAPGNDGRVCFWALELKLFGVFGVAPNLRRCLECEKPAGEVEMARVHFHAARGGFVCPSCQPGNAGLELSRATLALLVDFQRLPAGKVALQSLSEPMRHQIEMFCRAYFDFHLEEVGRLQSLEFVRELRETHLS